MTNSDVLPSRIQAYIDQQESHERICSINDILEIISDYAKEIALPVDKTISVELHHFEPYTTVIVTVPASKTSKPQGPYTFKIRTS